MKKKICYRCRLNKRLTDFPLARNAAAGRQSWCRVCFTTYGKEKRVKINARRKAWREKNKAREKLKDQKYYQDHKGDFLERLRTWRSRNRVKASVLCRNRQCRLQDAVGDFTAEQWERKKLEFANCCAYCGEEKKLTIHHLIPLAKGGHNFIEDVVPACQSCNSRIGTEIVLPEGYENY